MSNPIEPTTESNQAEALTPKPNRPLVIPGCAVSITCEEEDGIAIEQLLSIVFQLAASNPGANVDFWIRISEEQ